MKKILLALVATTLFLSCTTLKDPSKENIGLVLIPHKAKVDTSDSNNGKYVYVIKSVHENTKKRFIIPDSEGFGKIYLKPGDYYISQIDFHTDPGIVSNFEIIEINDYPFTVAHGEISILPITFTTIFEEIHQGRFSMNFHIYQVTNTERKNAISSLQELEGLKNWAIN